LFFAGITGHSAWNNSELHTVTGNLLFSPAGDSPTHQKKGLMVKAYLRYVLKQTFGVIASPACNAIFVDTQCRVAAAGALENISVWNMKQAIQVCGLVSCPVLCQARVDIVLHGVWDGTAQVNLLKGDKANTTCLLASPDRKHIAAGYVAQMQVVLNHPHPTPNHIPICVFDFVCGWRWMYGSERLSSQVRRRQRQGVGRRDGYFGLDIKRSSLGRHCITLQCLGVALGLGCP
jgi:hypothetical protein